MLNSHASLMTSPTTSFELDVEDSVAVVRLARPERKNALTFEMYSALRDLFRAAHTDRTVRAFMIEGAGDNFCSGGDVFEIIEGLAPSNRGELEITDVNRVYAQRGDLAVRRVEGWWHDGGKHWADLADVGRQIEHTGVNK